MNLDEKGFQHIPTLRQWLGDGARAEGFEEFVLATLNAEDGSDPGVQASMRVVRTLLVAMVEAGRREDEAGSDAVDTLLRMGRGLGYAFMAAMVSKGSKDMPLLRAKKMALEMVGEGAALFVQHERAKPAKSEPESKGEEG